MNLFKKQRVKEGTIIVDHGNNDIRVYRTPGNLVNMNLNGAEKEKLSSDHKKVNKRR